jgi:hypothetical protein
MSSRPEHYRHISLSYVLDFGVHLRECGTESKRGYVFIRIICCIADPDASGRVARDKFAEEDSTTKNSRILGLRETSLVREKMTGRSGRVQKRRESGAKITEKKNQTENISPAYSDIADIPDILDMNRPQSICS